MQYFDSYPCLHNFRKWTTTTLTIYILFFLPFVNSFGQTTILHGRDKEIGNFQVQTGDKYYDSGGPGGSRLPDQPGNYLNCGDPFNESTNCTSLYTFCSQGDTVTLNFKDYLIVTGDRLRIFSGKAASGNPLYNSVNQGVSLNGMKLTTGTLIKSKSTDGCLTVEWFCTTIGNSVGWEADFIVTKKSDPGDLSCLPTCKSAVVIELPFDTCYVKTSVDQYISNLNTTCSYDLKLFYPVSTNNLANQAVDQSHINLIFLYQVRDTSTLASCFGYLTVRSSAFGGPFCVNDTISCLEWDINFAPVLRSDGCNGTSHRTLQTRYDVMNCDDFFIGKVFRVIERNLTNGSIDTCRDTIYIKKLSLDSLKCPSDLKLTCEKVPGLKGNALTPDLLLAIFDLNNDYLIDGTAFRILPTLDALRFPDSSSTCRTTLNYTDFIIPGCGNTFKIRRQWIIKSQCLGVDSICIQNISVDDLSGPDVFDLHPLSYQLNAGECTSSFLLDTFANSTDCNVIAQRVEISYSDPRDRSKLIVVNGALPIKLTLPEGGYNLKFTFSDPCFNATRKEVCLWISDPSIPSSSAPVDTALILDPATCWTRIRAIDFKNEFSSFCCNDLHIVAASQDSIDYYLNKLKKQIAVECNPEDSVINTTDLNNILMDHWITAFVFKPYLDLTACGDHHIVLRAFKSCLVPAKDGSFTCGDHDWFCYNSIPEYRLWYNKSFGKSLNCSDPYPINCTSKLQQALKDGDATFKYFTTMSFNDSISCISQFYRTELSAVADLYRDAKILIHILDTLNIEDIILPDISYSVIGEVSCCSNTICLGEVYNSQQWPGPIGCNCDTGAQLKYYGGPIHSSAQYDTSGYYTYPTCSYYDVIQFPKPIYCRSGIIGDTSIQKETPLDSIFSRPVFNKLAGKNEFSIRIPCDSAVVQFSDKSDTSENCGQKITTRTWSIITSCGKSIHAIQKLIIRQSSNIEVVFPADVSLDCQMLSGNDTSIPVIPFIPPSLKGDNIQLMQVQFYDSLIPDMVGQACKIIQRTWIIKDPCSDVPYDLAKPEFILNDSMVADTKTRYCVYRSLKDNGDGFMSYRQFIRFQDLTAPVITVPDTVVVSGLDCFSGAIILPFELKDDCTPSAALVLTVALDQFNDGSIDGSVNLEGQSFKLGDLPVGKHRVIAIAMDLCGNSDTLVSFADVKDGGAPTPRCLTSNTIISIPSSGRLEIFAKDFDNGSLAGCSSGPLNFSFSSVPSDSFRVFSCDSLGTKPLKIWISNQSNKQSSCTVVLQVSATSDACTAASEFRIDGKVTTIQKSSIPGVNIRTNLFNTLPVTDGSGLYSLSNLAKGQSIKITPDKVDDPLNGISTLDLLVMEKHIKGQTLITDPYLLIAADINKSGSISVTDIIELRKLILGTVNTFPNNKPWIFIPTSFKFLDPGNPWNYPGFLEYPGLNSSISNADFFGIKVGDLNNSAVLGAIGLESRQSASIPLSVKSFVQGESRYWSVFVTKTFQNVEAFQLNLVVPDGTFIDSDYSTQFNLTKNEEYTLNQRLLSIAWTNSTGQEFNANQPLFTLNIPFHTAMKKPEFQIKSPSFLLCDTHLNPLDMINFYNESSPTITAFPNPSSDQILIKFFSSNPIHDKIQLTNFMGCKMDMYLPVLSHGWNYITLNKSDLRGPGQYYFSVRSDVYDQRLMFIML